MSLVAKRTTAIADAADSNDSTSISAATTSNSTAIRNSRRRSFNFINGTSDYSSDDESESRGDLEAPPISNLTIDSSSPPTRARALFPWNLDVPEVEADTSGSSRQVDNAAANSSNTPQLSHNTRPFRRPLTPLAVRLGRFEQNIRQGISDVISEIEAPKKSPENSTQQIVRDIALEQEQSSLVVSPEENCVICLEPAIPGENEFVKLNCGHAAFHLQCMAQWMEYAETCPICRADIRTFEDSSGQIKGIGDYNGVENHSRIIHNDRNIHSRIEIFLPRRRRQDNTPGDSRLDLWMLDQPMCVGIFCRGVWRFFKGIVDSFKCLWWYFAMGMGEMLDVIISCCCCRIIFEAHQIEIMGVTARFFALMVESCVCLAISMSMIIVIRYVTYG